MERTPTEASPGSPGFRRVAIETSAATLLLIGKRGAVRVGRQMLPVVAHLVAGMVLAVTHRGRRDTPRTARRLSLLPAIAAFP